MKWMRFVWALLCVASPALGAGREIPVDNLSQAISTRAGIVASGGELHFRCACGEGHLTSKALLEPLRAAAPPLDPARVAPGHLDPLLIVVRMFLAFENRNAEGWVSGLSREYRFDSDDPGFRARFPRGFTREDELRFVTHLFSGGGHAPDGSPLPVALSVSDEQGPLWVEAEAIGASHAVARVRRFGPVLTMSDGSRLTLGGSENTIELLREDDRWWIVAWHEHVTGEPDAGAIAAAAETASRPGGASGAGQSDDTAAVALPEKLAIRSLVDHAQGKLAFALALPSRGGELELFDLMGRRLARRDLSDLRPGTHHVALPGDMPAGVYWARLRQDGFVTSTRVNWFH